MVVVKRPQYPLSQASLNMTERHLSRSERVKKPMSVLLICTLLICAAGGFVPAHSQQSSTPAAATVQGDPSRSSVTAEPPGTERASKLVSVGLPELSPLSMFWSAGLVVQAIITGLMFASIVSWTIFIGKFIEMFTARRRLVSAVEVGSLARSLKEAITQLEGDKSVVRAFFATAVNELSLSSGLGNDTGVKERVASSFAEVTRAEARRVRLGMGALATIGATSPFVGLFGTVWGIMTSFIGISKSQTTNLAVVAPGIAEALLATAIGLLAAIPAVIIYNHFARVTKGYLELVNVAAGLAGRQLSRDLDRLQSRHMSRAAE